LNMNPFVFIVGCQRSGTTLLQRVLNAHPQVAITPESNWIPRLAAKPWALTDDGLVTSKLVSRLLAHRKFARLQLDEKRILAISSGERRVSYSFLVSQILDLYGEMQGKPLVGDKTPAYVRSINLLHRLWPAARFVHVIRDGRDVALSMLEWPKVRPKPGDFLTWNEDPVSTAALWWDLNVNRGRGAGNSLGPELYYEVRYESLVANPREECAALCAFLHLTFDDRMLQFYAVRGGDPGLEKKCAGLPITQGLRDWRSQMPPEQVENFEAIAGDLLEDLGYRRAVPRLSSEALQHSNKIRESFAQDPLAQKLVTKKPLEALHG
jgi:hypothetical protein